MVWSVSIGLYQLICNAVHPGQMREGLGAPSMCKQRRLLKKTGLAYAQAHGKHQAYITVLRGS